jgi:hypothetical protein
LLQGKGPCLNHIPLEMQGTKACCTAVHDNHPRMPQDMIRSEERGLPESVSTQM